MTTPAFDPSAFRPASGMPPIAVCLRCGAVVAGAGQDDTEPLRRHHDWHVAVDAALAAAGAPMGVLNEVSRLRP